MIGIIPSTKAQITVNKEHLPSAGDSILIATLEAESSIDMGEASDQAQVWDFSDLEEDTTELLIYLNSENTNYSIDGSTFALNLAIKISGIPIENSYMYFNEEDSGIYTKAIIANILGDDIIMESSDQELFFPHPMEYGASFEDQSRFEGSMGTRSILRESSKTMVVDAFGTLILPGDSSYEVIRLKEIVQSTDVIKEGQIPLSTTTVTETRYRFFSNNSALKHPIFSAYSNNSETVQYISWIHLENNISESIDKVMQETIQWKSYPNPAKDELNIHLDNIKNGFYKLGTYNFIGQLISTKNIHVLDETSEVQLETNNLPNGVYFVNLSDQQGNMIVSQKFNVVH